jgi:hypothetical protein
MTETPDELIFDTLSQVVVGRATRDDLRAAITLSLDLPGWSERKRRTVEHLLVCDSCLNQLIARIRVVVVETIRETEGLETLPTKGVH